MMVSAVSPTPKKSGHDTAGAVLRAKWALGIAEAWHKTEVTSGYVYARNGQHTKRGLRSRPLEHRAW